MMISQDVFASAKLNFGRVFVVVPTYNEVENITALAAALFELPVARLHLLIVDDASPDGTGQVAERLKSVYPNRVHVIHRAGKNGLGTAYREGFRYALNHGATAIIQMDADFSHSPDYLPEMLSKLAQNDIVVGSRYADHGSLDPTWSYGRYLLSWWANSVYIRLILGLKQKDATAGFKAWNRKALESVLNHSISSQGYVFQVEMAYVAEKLGLRTQELPIYFRERRFGTSKMSLRIKLEAAWNTLGLRWRYRKIEHMQRGPSEKPRLSYLSKRG